MKKHTIILALILLFSTTILAQKGWVSLTDGKTFANWHIYNKAGQPISDKWAIVDGAMTYVAKATGNPQSDDLISDQEYENFELELDWNISEGGNSGIFYAVHEEPKYRVPYVTSPEIQVLDNERHPDAKQGKDGNRKAGSLYDMIPSAAVAKPAGEWNHVKILKNKGEITVWQNGTLAVKFLSAGPTWEAMVANSKFKTWEGFGKYPKGHIGLQDHGNGVAFKNVKVKEL